MRYVIGILVFLVAVFLPIIVLGGQVVDFINLPVTVFLLFVIVAIVIMKGGFKTLIAAINALLSKKYNISAAEKEKAIRLLRLIAKSVIYASILFTMICLVNILMNLDFQHESAINALGINIAATLIFIFQALFINMVFINPAIDILESRHNAEVKTMISEKQVMDKLLELCYKQGISPEEILDAGEISFRKKQ